MLNAKEKSALLKQAPLFAECSDRELSKIAGVAKEVSRAAGKTIVHEGDPGSAFILIVDGTAKVSVHGRTAAQLGAGDYFGEIALLDKKPRTATVTAASDLHYLVLSAASFRIALKAYPTIGLRLLKELAGRVRSLERSLTG